MSMAAENLPPPPSALDTARDYIRRGWAPVPVPYRQKGPVLPGWQHLRVTEDNASRYFSGASNVGVLPGAASGGLTDVDLDCQEARAVAPYLLPPRTAIFGRDGARSSHYLYRTDLHEVHDKALIQFKDPKAKTTGAKAMLVELRFGAGIQTVFPGSVHETGEAIAWEPDCEVEPQQVDGADLVRRVERLAAAALLARYWPAHGARHEARLTVVGVLQRAKFAGVDAKLFIQALCSAVPGEDLKDFVEALRSTETRASTGQSITGFPALRAIFGPEVAQAVAGWLHYQEATREGNVPSASQSTAWPDPRPIESHMPSVKPFDGDLLPSVLRDYVLDVSDRQQSPPDFAAVSALCAVAALAGNHVRIAPKGNDDWEVVPTLWGANIGRPSMMKSPAMQAALAPIRGIEDRAIKEWSEAQKETEIDAELHGLQSNEVTRAARAAIKGGDCLRARKLIAEHRSAAENASPCPRFVFNDSTVEKLGELLNQNKHGLLMVRDELAGWLARMSAEEYQGDRAFYLEAFNGDGSFTYDRIGRGTVIIECATVSIVGGVQPSKIAPLVRGAMGGASDDGLLQRFQMAVWPDDLKDWTWVDRRPDAGAKARYEAAFTSIKAFARSLDEPVVFRFAPEAQELFKAWMVELQTEARSRKLPSVFESYLLKMPKTVASLALLFELLDGGREHVGVIATGRALDWADYLKSHAARLYAAGTMMAESGARLIAERRGQLPERFTARDVQRKGWAGLHDRDLVADALDFLVEACHVRASATSNDGAGRPSEVYEWNPKLGKEA